MTYMQACVILSVSSDKQQITKNKLKKRYRELMHKAHPDARGYAASDDSAYKYSAYEINEAYSYLCDYMDKLIQSQSSHKMDSNEVNSNSVYASYESTNCGWDAPVNTNAYCNRNIYHYAENYAGERIGHFKVACGKYIWTVEEDFSLFIRSIFECSEELLNAVDTDNIRKPVIQAELAYLLAQQFIEATDTLDCILTSLETEGSKVYYVAAMLEVVEDAPYIRAGMKLYPSGIRKHRLYLKTQSGREAGYVSLKDDRLYYILIPILEHRHAQVKAMVALKQDRKNMQLQYRHKNLDFWVKLNGADTAAFPENINMQIEKLLREYSM